LDGERFGQGESEPGNSREAIVVLKFRKDFRAKGVGREHKTSRGIPGIPFQSALPLYLGPGNLHKEQKREKEQKKPQFVCHKSLKEELRILWILQPTTKVKEFTGIE
jgi:hypothetical protein